MRKKMRKHIAMFAVLLIMSTTMAGCIDIHVFRDLLVPKDEVVIVTAVGAGLRETPGVAARIFGALGSTGINVIAIAQGSSEHSISLVVSAKDGETAMQYIHQEAIIHE